MAIMVAALKGRKMVLDLMGVTDEVRKIPRYHIYTTISWLITDSLIDSFPPP